MKALVTGATGFIGANVVRELLDHGHAVRALARAESPRTNLEGLEIETAVGDLRDRPSLRAALDGCDALFHVAASYSFWTPDPSLVYEANVQGTENVLRAARDAGIDKIVVTSSESTIGIHGQELGTERSTATVESLAGHYKKSKLLAEELALRMCADGLPLVIVNPTMPLGPWDLKPTPTGQVIVDFLNGRMPGYVDTRLNVVDVRDVARGHLLALEKGRPGERYILGHRNVTFRELLGMLEAVTGRRASNLRIPIGVAMAAALFDDGIRGRILRRPPRIPLAAVRTARKSRHFDCSKAIQELGLPQTPVETAICDAASWFERHGYVTRSPKRRR